MTQRAWTFERREGESGYVWATGSDGCKFHIYLQYDSIDAIPNKKRSDWNPKTLKMETEIVEEYPVVELSSDERAELLSQARAFARGESVKPSEEKAPAPVELPSDVAALVSRYGSSEAAWEAENETACFRMREYGL